MDTALKPNKNRHCISFSWKLFLSVISLFIVFALCFIAYQYQREKEYKVELLNMQLQDYNERMYMELHALNDSLWDSVLDRYIARYVSKGLRVTIINLQGKVLYDNMGDSLLMENHIGRPEIQKALRDGKGYDVRRVSETTGVSYFYSSTLYDKFIIRSALPYSLNLLNHLSADPHYIWFTVTITLLLAFFYTFSSLFLLCGYGYMGAGVATTLHFTYPVFVSLLMFLLFREKASWLTWVSIAMAVCGVALLSLPSTGMSADVKGIIIVILSAVAYGSYIVGVNKSRVRNMNSRKLAFYVFIFTTVIFGVKDLASGSLQMPPDISSVGNLVLLAVLPTVVSNITLVLAVQNIGGTLTSVLGALEPLTAVCIGALVFGEDFTMREASGILLVLVAVTVIILTGSIQGTIDKVFKKIRPRHA